MPKLGTLPPLKKGTDLQTLKDNSLALMAAGMDKGEAMALSLNLAGLRPSPEVSPASTKSSPVKPQLSPRPA